MAFNSDLYEYISSNTSNQKLEIESFNNSLPNFINNILTTQIKNLKYIERNLQ